VSRPLHRPVEIWMPIASGKSIDWMARHNFKALIALCGKKYSTMC